MINFDPDILICSPAEPSTLFTSTYHPASVYDSAKAKPAAPLAFLTGLHAPGLIHAFETGQMLFSVLPPSHKDGDADSGSPIDQLQGDDLV